MKKAHIALKLFLSAQLLLGLAAHPAGAQTAAAAPGAPKPAAAPASASVPAGFEHMPTLEQAMKGIAEAAAVAPQSNTGQPVTAEGAPAAVPPVAAVALAPAVVPVPAAPAPVAAAAPPPPITTPTL